MLVRLVSNLLTRGLIYFSSPSKVLLMHSFTQQNLWPISKLLQHVAHITSTIFITRWCLFSSLISLSPPSLKPMTSKILFNWQVSILVLPEWEYGIRACLWNTPFSLGSWDTSCSWFTTKCSGYSFLGLFAGSSSPWPLTMRH